MHTITKSTTIKKTLNDKRKLVQASIQAQTGQLRPNLRRHEGAPITDIDALLASKPSMPTNTLF